MFLKILCLLILLNSLQTYALGRIPIANNFKNNASPKLNDDTSSEEHLNLPRGFDPQSAPTNPLLYPFVTEQPATKKTSTTASWRPIVMETTVIQRSSFTPLLQDRISNSAEFQQDVKPFVESIVYGAWKSERPLQPKNSFMEKAANVNSSGHLEEKIMNGKLGGFIEDINSKKPTPEVKEKSATSNESFENFKTNKKQFIRKLGRRKIPGSNKSNNQLNESQTTSTEIIRVNATDPTLLDMVKEINESVETINKKMIGNDETTSKEWPKDFINSTESKQTQYSGIQDNYFGSVGESSEPSQAFNGFHQAETNIPPAAINITKLGLPFENQNSDEEPTICVPLVIREPSASNSMETVEVERVYCFPLPAQEIKSDNEKINDTLVLDRDANFNVLSYEEFMASNARSTLKSSILVLSLSFFLI